MLSAKRAVSVFTFSPCRWRKVEVEVEAETAVLATCSALKSSRLGEVGRSEEKPQNEMRRSRLEAWGEGQTRSRSRVWKDENWWEEPENQRGSTRAARRTETIDAAKEPITRSRPGAGCCHLAQIPTGLTFPAGSSTHLHPLLFACLLFCCLPLIWI